MISVYYSKEVGNVALLYYKDGFLTWSDYIAIDDLKGWTSDEKPLIRDTPNIYIKLFEIE